jgi:signal-transduction protein with cAMP-binding, CBS, and nucleotidyltransferase domain
MTTNVVTMPPTASAQEIAETMHKMGIGSIIITEKERAIGIITETDIVRRLVAERREPQTTVAREIMSSPLIHVTPTTTLTEAMRVMFRSGTRRLAVLKNNSLAGIISSRDMIQWSPELIDILAESLQLRAESAVELEMEEDELVAYGGTCDRCGEYSTDLMKIDGEYICEICREELD